jgi:RNA polymerase sigma factor (sigma-70 family)
MPYASLTPRASPDPSVQGMTLDDLEQLLSQHHRAAFGWALTCCRWDRAAAEDVLQIAYLKTLDRRAKYDGQSTFVTFLFGVIRLTANEERRRNTLRTVFSIGAREENLAHGSSDGLAQLVEDEAATELVAALKQLASRQRDVLHLVFYQDLSIAGAAEVMGISVGAARSHYERGKANLRRLLGTKENR